MDDMQILLRTLSPHEFGLKPSREDLLLSLIENYGFEKSRAEQAFANALINNLIDIDSLSRRVSITEDGFKCLQNQNMQAYLKTASKVFKEDKSKKSFWASLGLTRTNTIVSIIGIVVTLMTLIKCHKNGG